MKCKALAKFLNSSIMIFIYIAYFAARIDFTLGKLLFLWQIFHLQGFPLPFSSSASHTQLPTSQPCVSFISKAQSCPLTTPPHWQRGWACPKPPWCPTPQIFGGHLAAFRPCWGSEAQHTPSDITLSTASQRGNNEHMTKRQPLFFLTSKDNALALIILHT